MNPNSMPVRLAAFIITLNRPQHLERTLEVLQGQTRPPDHVLIVDNGASAEARAVAAMFPSEWVSYEPMVDNIGPAGAAAFAIDRLCAQGYSWVYWGDDDDPPQTADSIERLLELAAAAGDDIGGVGSTGALWDWSTGKIQRIPDDDLSGVIDVDVIGGNQQLIIRGEAVKKAGLPDTRLFFGFEELEYCLRLRVAGYRLVVNGEVMRECRARAGRLNLAAPSRLRDCYPYNAMWRGYYSTRNYIFAMNRTFRRPDLARYEALKAVGRACLSWRGGPRVGAAVTMLQMRGIIDGVFGHMGRTVTPAPKYKTRAAAGAEGVGA